MTGEELEVALTEEIAGLGLPAMLWPEAEEETADVPAIRVRYAGAEWPDRALGGAQAQRIQRAEVIATGLRLRGEAGTFQAMERIRQRLDGYTLAGAAGPLELEQEGWSEENGKRRFGQKWKIKSWICYGHYDHYADDPAGA